MALDHRSTFGPFLVRSWQPGDREVALSLIAQVLTEYGLTCEPTDSDRDVLEVETYYWKTGGEFWVVEANGGLVGTAGYYPVSRGDRAVEIRKMYLLPQARGQGLGRYLLTSLEAVIQQHGYAEIWIETASVLKEAVGLYEASGYKPASGVETARCDRIYHKPLTPSHLKATVAPNLQPVTLPTYHPPNLSPSNLSPSQPSPAIPQPSTPDAFPSPKPPEFSYNRHIHTGRGRFDCHLPRQF